MILYVNAISFWVLLIEKYFNSYSNKFIKLYCFDVIISILFLKITVKFLPPKVELIIFDSQSIGGVKLLLNKLPSTHWVLAENCNNKLLSKLLSNTILNIEGVNFSFVLL